VRAATRPAVRRRPARRTALQAPSAEVNRSRRGWRRPVLRGAVGARHVRRGATGQVRRRTERPTERADPDRSRDRDSCSRRCITASPTFNGGDLRGGPRSARPPGVRALRAAATHRTEWGTPSARRCFWITFQSSTISSSTSRFSTGRYYRRALHVTQHRDSRPRRAGASRLAAQRARFRRDGRIPAHPPLVDVQSPQDRQQQARQGACTRRTRQRASARLRRVLHQIVDHAARRQRARMRTQPREHEMTSRLGHPAGGVSAQDEFHNRRRCCTPAAGVLLRMRPYSCIPATARCQNRDYSGKKAEVLIGIFLIGKPAAGMRRDAPFCCAGWARPGWVGWPRALLLTMPMRLNVGRTPFYPHTFAKPRCDPRRDCHNGRANRHVCKHFKGVPGAKRYRDGRSLETRSIRTRGASQRATRSS